MDSDTVVGAMLRLSMASNGGYVIASLLRYTVHGVASLEALAVFLNVSTAIGKQICRGSCILQYS